VVVVTTKPRKICKSFAIKSPSSANKTQFLPAFLLPPNGPTIIISIIALKQQIITNSSAISTNL